MKCSFTSCSVNPFEEMRTHFTYAGTKKKSASFLFKVRNLDSINNLWIFTCTWSLNFHTFCRIAVEDDTKGWDIDLRSPLTPGTSRARNGMISSTHKLPESFDLINLVHVYLQIKIFPIASPGPSQLLPRNLNFAISSSSAPARRSFQDQPCAWLITAQWIPNQFNDRTTSYRELSLQE